MMERGRGVAAGHYGRSPPRDRITFILFIVRDVTVTRQQLPRQPTTNAASAAIIGQFPWYLQDRGVHAWRGAGLDPESRLATGAGRGCDDVLETSLAGLGVGQTSGLIPDISADAAGTLRAATSRTLRKQYCSEGFRRRIFCAKASPFGGECPSMIQALKTLRAAQWAMLASIVLYGILGEVVGPVPRGVDPSLSYLFTTLAVAVVGVILVVRRTLVLRAGQSLRARPDDSLSLNHWRTGYIATYALCEALALFGLILRFRGSSWQQSILYYLGGFVLLLFFRPRQPDSI
jgi:hypothetical protein